MNCVYVILLIILAFFLVLFISRKKFEDENYTFFHPINTRYLPENLYTFQYFYNDSGGWPPGMYTRFRYDYPSFSSGSGWTYNMRPGVYYGDWGSNTWIRHDDDHYFINNGTDRRNDFYGSQS